MLLGIVSVRGEPCAALPGLQTAEIRPDPPRPDLVERFVSLMTQSTVGKADRVPNFTGTYSSKTKSGSRAQQDTNTLTVEACSSSHSQRREP